jgi:[ribosomal protein S5]-alanine N-acetyltransferase
MNKKNQPMRVEGKNVYLRFPEMKDAAEFIVRSRASVKFHRNLVKPARDVEAFKIYVRGNKTDSNRLFLIRRKVDDAIIGATNMSQIFHGGFKNAYLGYYLFAEFAGNGYMTEALKLMLGFAFGALKLHRLEANIQPHNTASIELVKRCGFTKEGYSRKYLKIGGKWRDHERWAIIREDWTENNKRSK